MRRWMLLFCIFPAVLTAGCSQIIADKVLVPTRNPDRVVHRTQQRLQSEREWGDQIAPFMFRSFDGTPITALMISPDCEPRAVIVLIHGITDQKESLLDIAGAFARDGYLAVLPDLRAHGESGGRYTSAGFYEKRDQVALLDCLASKGLDVSRVGVLGGSMGAAIAIQWGAIDPRIKAIVAVAPFAELRTEMGFLFHRFNVPGILVGMIESAAQEHGRFKVDSVSPLQAVKSMNTPLYLAHGFIDEVIPLSESERLYEAARGPVVLQKAYCGHMSVRATLGRQFLRRAVSWMDTYVPLAGPSRQPPQWIANYSNRNFSAPSGDVADVR